MTVASRWAARKCLTAGSAEAGPGSESRRNSSSLESGSAAAARLINSSGDPAWMAMHSLPKLARRSRGLTGAGREASELVTGIGHGPRLTHLIAVACRMQQLYQRFASSNRLFSPLRLQDAGEEQGVFLLGIDGILAKDSP